VKTRKLSSVDGFVLFDLPEAPTSVGVVRSAPKILQGGAEMLARSVTYSFAVFGMQAGGASAGVNAKPDERSAAVAAFAEEAAGIEGLVLDAGRGVDEADLAPLRARDPRPGLLHERHVGSSGSDELVAAGALAAVGVVAGGVEGKRIAIEGFGPAGLALARQAVAEGATVVAVAAGNGTALDPGGFDPGALEEAWAAHDEGLTKVIGGEQKPAWAVWGADADVIFAGSKAGAMTHEGAAYVKARTVAPIGPVPITSKSLAVLGRAGVAYLPDFVSVAAPLLVGVGGVDPLEAPGRIAELVTELSAHPDGLFLGCCKRAEDFLRTWRDDLPFGRPLA
jgi:glutamate dehydrogenase/leucine dehydrogenase